MKYIRALRGRDKSRCRGRPVKYDEGGRSVGSCSRTGHPTDVDEQLQANCRPISCAGALCRAFEETLCARPWRQQDPFLRLYSSGESVVASLVHQSQQVSIYRYTISLLRAVSLHVCKRTSACAPIDVGIYVYSIRSVYTACSVHKVIVVYNRAQHAPVPADTYCDLEYFFFPSTGRILVLHRSIGIS